MRAALTRLPPLRKYSVIPVSRTLWLAISRGRPASRAQRLTIFSAVWRVVARRSNVSAKMDSRTHRYLDYT